MNTIHNNHKDNSWQDIIAKYNFPDESRSWWQIINSVIPFAAMWVLMYFTLQFSYILSAIVAVIAAGFMIRIFIIFHDCGHGSFFRSGKLNSIVGIITGLLVFTPYHKWHYAHYIHHKTVGNLDKRGVGDVMTLTVNEYKKMHVLKRIGYRIFRHPIFLFGLAPSLSFIFVHRLTDKQMTMRQKLHVHLTSLGVIAIAILLIYVLGLKAYLMIQIPILFIAAGHGLWLFYVQHQFEEVAWVRSDQWDYKTIALQGSSYFKLPPVLQWFTGNIGFHHIHHLSPKIPNYKLAECYHQNPEFQCENPITFLSSLKTLKLRLWDEERQKMIGFKELPK